MPTPSQPGSAPSPDALLADYLARRAAGSTLEFEALCRAHPEQAQALRERLEQAEQAQLALKCALRAAESDAPAAAHASTSAAPSFATRLRQKYGAGVDPEVSLDEPSSAAAESGTSELVRRLREHSLEQSRYALQGEIARGGMGAILKVWDEDLRRHLAMKVILGKADSAAEGGTPAVDPRTLGRFLEEAQVTGQLDHPGIVPVHELGLDSDGRVYFTMKLVKGRDLKHVFDLVFAEQEGWNETRALSVILKACEAMAYAHKKGVIHRDLKPANVMVGNFGEVYVMDWGLARVLGRKDTHDIRIAPELATALSSIKTERRDEREELSDSPIVTMDGDVMGTPAYMAPEQARGEIEQLGPRSDVYSMGALLYHLLARQVPYVPRGARLSNRTVLGLVVNGPPAALSMLRPDTPAELVAIVEKAMAREASPRYADTLALAEDLRAFLEHRVVGAYETGAWAEARKWVQRNKPLAAALAGAVVLLIAGLTSSLVFKAQADERATDLQAANSTIQARNGQLTAARNTAEEKVNDVLSLSAIQDLKELEQRADELWPADPEHLPQYDAWLADARLLIEGRPADLAKGQKNRPGLVEHAANLARIRQRARASAQLAEPVAQPGGEVHEPATYEFEDGEDRWWHAQLSKLVADLQAFTDAHRGGLFSTGVSEEHGWGILRRAEFARTISERSVDSAAARRRWEEAGAAISSSPKYGGLTLAPQRGLLPLGVDPQSGLWEFAHLQTGEPPERGPDRKLILSEGLGLVFVLIPGGTFWMGAQATDPHGRNYDPQASSDESPVHEVTLSPYFLSKYEMTQRQWERFTGKNPSQYREANYSSSWNKAGESGSVLHPVEQVSWTDCRLVLGRIECALPTEAQWEYACRAGTSSVYWCGDGLEGLDQVANLSDTYAHEHSTANWPWEKSLDDGSTVHAAVGSYRANPFGLHEVHGNLWEWCLDGYANYTPGAQVDPVVDWQQAARRVYRGGSFGEVPADARSAFRDSPLPDTRDPYLGLRPARAVRLAAPHPEPQVK